MEKIRFGIIGCGSIARLRHLPEINANPDTELVVVCDANPVRAKEIGEKYVAEYTSDYREMLKRNDIDAVVVCTTNATHAGITVEALEAGKHVLCEKPMATNIVDALSMLKAAEKTGKLLMIGHNQRLVPCHIKAKELLKDGKLGPVNTFASTFGHAGCEYFSIDGKNTWMFDRSLSGLGAMGDLALHKIDLLRWLIDDDFCEAAAMSGTRSKKNEDGSPVEVDDNDCLLLRTKNGAFGTVTASWSYSYEENSTVLYCENGIMEIFKKPGIDIAITYSDGTNEEYDLGGIQTNERQTDSGVSKHFADCISNGKKPVADGYEGYKTLEVVLACMKSCDEHRFIKIEI